MDALEQIVALPSRGRITSAGYLRMDADWDAVRQEPRFLQIIAKAAAGEY